MTPQGSPLTLWSRAAQLRDRTTVHLLPVLLAANSANAYHGLLSEARRVSSPSAKTSRSTRRASLALPTFDSENRPALLRRRIYTITLQTGKNSGNGHEERRASTAFKIAHLRNAYQKVGMFGRPVPLSS
jgi:hypothetical protein